MPSLWPLKKTSELSTLLQSRHLAIRSTVNCLKNLEMLVWWQAMLHWIPMLLVSWWQLKSLEVCFIVALKLCEKSVGSFLMKFITWETKVCRFLTYTKLILFLLERGVVWEETIILLPDNVHYVFLSATIPNAKEFAAWIANLHNQICHIVYTDYRPTPLQHVFYSSGSNGLYEVVNVQVGIIDWIFSLLFHFLGWFPRRTIHKGDEFRKRPRRRIQSTI